MARPSLVTHVMDVLAQWSMRNEQARRDAERHAGAVDVEYRVVEENPPRSFHLDRSLPPPVVPEDAAPRGIDKARRT